MDTLSAANNDTLLRDLQSADASTRQAAAEQLGRSGAAEPSVLQALNERVTHDDVRAVRQAAADAYLALSHLAEPAKAAPHDYYLPGRGVMLAAGVAFVGLGLGLLVLAGGRPVTTPTRPRAAYAPYGLLVMGAALALTAIRYRLRLSADGLEYQTIMDSVSAGWGEVIDLRRLSAGSSPKDVLILASDKQISLNTFGGNDWRSGSLGDDLQTWTPQLLKRFDAAQP